MIQLDRHIEILLLDNDCVIVPGFGGFMAHHVCARFDDEMGVYLPPIRQLGFNAQLTLNDSVLVQSYIEAYDISYPEALRKIEDEVNELQQKMQNEGSCELMGVGTLRYNDEGRVEFIPCEAGILTPELYGLDSVELSLLTNMVSGDTHVRSELSGLTSVPKPEKSISPNSADAVEHKRGDKDERTITIRVSTLKRVGVAAATILALVGFGIPFGQMIQPELTKSNIEGVFSNLLPQPEAAPAKAEHKPTRRTVYVYKTKPAPKAVETAEAKDDMVDIYSLKPTDNTATAETAAEAKTPETAKPEAKAEVKAEPQNFYSIVLASRVTKANADDYVVKLKARGLKEAEAITRNNKTKVIYGHYASESEAHAALSSLRGSNTAFSDSWITEVK